MLGTHVCMGITYKSKYYRISHIAYHLLNRISANFQPSPPSFLNITLYVAVAPPKLPLSYLVVAGPAQTTPLLPRCRRPRPSYPSLTSLSPARQPAMTWGPHADLDPSILPTV